jgi:hypothetical protein
MPMQARLRNSLLEEWGGSGAIRTRFPVLVAILQLEGE